MFNQLPEFLYVDIEKTTEYIASLHGSVPDGKITQKKSKRQKAEGGLGFQGLKISGGLESSDELAQERTIRSSALFLKLHSILEEKGMIQYLDAFDEIIWNQLRRNEFLEVKAIVTIPKIFKTSQTATNLGPKLKQLSALDSSGEAEVGLKALEAIIGLVEQKNIPLVFTAKSTPHFRFVAKLRLDSVNLEDLSDLESELTVFGRIRKVVKKGRNLAEFSIIPDLGSQILNLDRNERAKKEAELISKGSIEIVKGPGIELIPLAVYID